MVFITKILNRMTRWREGNTGDVRLRGGGVADQSDGAVEGAHAGPLAVVSV